MNAKMVEYAKIVMGLPPIIPSSSTPDYVSMKNYSHLTVIILADNATTVTGSAITTTQATAVAGTGAKTLALTEMWANIDTGATDTLVKTAVTSNTFTTDSTDAKNLMYVIEIDARNLDVEGGFDAVTVGTGDATASIISVCYILSNGYMGATPPAAITD